MLSTLLASFVTSSILPTVPGSKKNSREPAPLLIGTPLNSSDPFKNLSAASYIFLPIVMYPGSDTSRCVPYPSVYVSLGLEIRVQIDLSGIILFIIIKTL